MALMCEHCQAPVNKNEALAVFKGFSYHEKCRKCYVCSETNLHGAEVFKGVIFCSSCSQRIFQGCATARKTKEIRRNKERSHRRRSHRTRERPAVCKPQNGILAMTRLTAGNDSSKSCSVSTKDSKLSKSLAVSTEITLKVGNLVLDETSPSTKISNVDMGMTTEVTQKLLKELNCPVVIARKKSTQILKPTRKPSPKNKKKIRCSDLRIAELGTSREIANMALKHRSEQPVIIESNSLATDLPSQSGSLLNRESESGDRNEDWMDSAYSTLQDSTKTHWMDRRLRSIIKFPYRAFKRNILNRSSLISVLMSSEDKGTFIKKIKLLFKEEATDHQRRGLQRLYSTINRQKISNKMGWLKLVVNAHGNTEILSLSKSSDLYRNSSELRKRSRRCHHFKMSHSYRCMRAQVMKLAGPTKSELYLLRTKMKNFISPGFFRNKAIDNKLCPAITVSHACGNSKPGSTK